MTFDSVPSDFPRDLYEGFVKVFRRPNRPAVASSFTLGGLVPFLGMLAATGLAAPYR
jgi:hypothetical protein